MPISKEHKCIFVHIPKVAGTSIEFVFGMHGDRDNVGLAPYENQVKNFDTLFGNGLQHLTALEIRNLVDDYNDYFKFAFVRNPWDRLVSSVFFNSSFRNIIKKELSKDEFAKRVKMELKRKRSHFIPQFNFLCDDNGEIIVDFIGRYENLDEDFNKVCEINGLNLQLPHRMKTNHKKYTEYYNKDTEQLVADVYAKDIEYFNYKFGD